jgi:radical SAM-linked protein
MSNCFCGISYLKNACFCTKYIHNIVKSTNLGAKFEKTSHVQEKKLITETGNTVSVLIKFKIEGSLRYLSHAETLRLFQRACTRAGVNLQYSQGFNPRPKLSLALPRSVGVESDDEMLILRVQTASIEDAESHSELQTIDTEELQTNLSRQLPENCCLLSVTAGGTKGYPQINAVTYVITLKPECLGEQMSARIKQLSASETLRLQRMDPKGNTREIDVRGFLKTIGLADNNIVIECKVSPSGTVRVDELLQLLHIEHRMLAVPVKRTKIQWHYRN